MSTYSTPPHQRRFIYIYMWYIDYKYIIFTTLLLSFAKEICVKFEINLLIVLIIIVQNKEMNAMTIDRERQIGARYRCLCNCNTHGHCT